MSRTLKFQLSNIKQSLFYSILIAFGIMGLFLIIALFLDQNVFVNISDNPFWLNLLSLFAAPLSAMKFFYPIYEGSIYFDSSLRFGLSRKVYFYIQAVLYSLLAVLVSFTKGISEITWTGSTSEYFNTMFRDYLSLEQVGTELVTMLLITIVSLLFYRYKSKVFIPIIVLAIIIPFVRLFGEIALYIDNNVIQSILGFIIEFSGLFQVLIVIAIFGVYFKCLTTFEVQD